ncbi:MAG: hypothetical protein QOJ19_4931 [Acidimicrobiia bacterium]|jgi:hypothetical protein|nr:hypothetical protein [Acidimicrobiia bacterium]
MAQDRPLWRATIDSVDKVIGPASERLVRTERFADVVAVMSRVRHEVRQRTERALRQQWHVWNLPAGSDVKRLSEQVASLERQVRQLTKQVEDSGSADSDGASARRNVGREVRPGSNNERAQPGRDRQSSPS